MKREVAVPTSDWIRGEAFVPEERMVERADEVLTHSWPERMLEVLSDYGYGQRYLLVVSVASGHARMHSR